MSLLVCFVVVLLFTTEARPAALPLFSCVMTLVVSSRVGSSSSSGLKGTYRFQWHPTRMLS